MNATSHSGPAHPVDELVPYLLGELDPLARAAVDGHLDRCSSCRAELARLDQGLVAAVEALPPEPPSDAVWSAIEARIAAPTARHHDHAVRPAEAPATRTPPTRTPPTRTPSTRTPSTKAPSVRAPSTGPRPARAPRASARRGWPTGLAAALALTVAVGVWGVGQRQLALELRADLAAARAPADERIATLDAALADLDTNVEALATEQASVARWLSEAAVTVAAIAGDGGAVGAVLYRADGAALVVMRDAPGPGRSLQAWGVAGGAVTSLGAFEGRVLEVSANGFEAVAVSLEPLGGSPTPTEVLGAAARSS